MSGPQYQEAKEQLLVALRARNIPLGNDDIDWAFASPRTRDDITAWVKEHLQDDTLLSKDELISYQNIAAKYKPSTDADNTVIVHDYQLTEALESLRASTSLIEQHTRVLEKQRDALELLQRQSQDHAQITSSNSPSRVRNGENGTHAFMASRQTFQISPNVKSNGSSQADEISLAVQEEFAAAYKQSNKSTSALMALTTERLGADDEVLTALTKLAPRAMPQSGSSTTLDKVEQWTRALSVMREQEANARIDTMIDQNVLELLASNQEHSSAFEAGQVEDIESELKSLRDEIGSVVELVVGSEFRQPLSRLLRSSQSQSQVSQHEWLGYILATMEHMIRQVDEISNCAEDIRSYNNTLVQIRDAFSTAMGTNTANQLPDDPATLKQASSRPTTASASASTSLAEQVFRRFAITGRTNLASLESASEVATSKLESQYASVGASTAEVVSKSLEEQRKELQTILKQLYAFSDFASVQLLPKDLENSVQSLDDAIGETARTLSNAEAGKHEDVRCGIAKLRSRLNE